MHLHRHHAQAFMIMALLVVGGCDTPDTTPDGLRSRGFADGRRPRVSSGGLIVPDIVDTWNPIARHSESYLTGLGRRYAENMQNLKTPSRFVSKDAYQINIVDYGHIVQKALEDYEPLEWERYFCQEILFQQSRVFVESNHQEDAILALDAAQKIGFADTERVLRSSLANHLKDPKIASIVQRMKEEEPLRISERINACLALQNDSPYFTLVKDLEGNDVDLANEFGRWNVVFITATWCPTCAEMSPNVQVLYEEFKNQDVRFFGVSFERGSGQRTSDFKAIEDFKKERGLDFPFFAAQSRFYLEIREFVSFPTMVVMDKLGRIVASSNGYQSTPVLRGILRGSINRSDYAQSL